jgi:hypothetical protein
VDFRAVLLRVPVERRAVEREPVDLRADVLRPVVFFAATPAPPP